jgi:hypothetical protein
MKIGLLEECKSPKNAKMGIFGRQGNTYAVLGLPSNLVGRYLKQNINSFFITVMINTFSSTRVRAAGYEIARPPPEVSRHSVLTHVRDKANPVNPGRYVVCNNYCSVNRGHLGQRSVNIM